MPFQASCARSGSPNVDSIAERVVSSPAAAAINKACPIDAGLNTTLSVAGSRRRRSKPASFHPAANTLTGASASTAARTRSALTGNARSPFRSGAVDDTSGAELVGANTETVDKSAESELAPPQAEIVNETKASGTTILMHL